MASKLFGEVLQGKKPESSFQGLAIDELKSLKNSAASIISRANEVEKRKRAEYLRSLIQAEIDKLEESKPQAEWKVKDVSELTIEDVNKALKQAQWYKHTYGPKAKAKWLDIKSKTPKTDPLYTKAINFLSKCDDYYNNSLTDEDYWLGIKESMLNNNPRPRNTEAAKLEEAKAILDSLQGIRLGSKAKEAIDKLKELIE